MAISFEELMGWWKLSEAWHEFEIAQRRYPFGDGITDGSLVFTNDSRMMLVILATTGIARQSHYIEAHSGPFALDGSEIIATVDFSSNVRHGELKYSASLGPHGLLCLTSRQTGELYDGAPFNAASNWYRVNASEHRRPQMTRHE